MSKVFSWYNLNDRNNFESGFAADDALLKDNLWLCYDAAFKFAAKVSFSDKRNDLMNTLMSVGLETLLKARKSFNPEKGVMFSTYAYRAVNGAIKKAYGEYFYNNSEPDCDEQLLDCYAQNSSYNDSYEFADDTPHALEDILTCFTTKEQEVIYQVLVCNATKAQVARELLISKSAPTLIINKLFAELLKPQQDGIAANPLHRTWDRNAHATIFELLTQTTAKKIATFKRIGAKQRADALFEEFLNSNFIKSCCIFWDVNEQYCRDYMAREVANAAEKLPNPKPDPRPPVIHIAQVYSAKQAC